MTLRVESVRGASKEAVSAAVISTFKAKIGIKIDCEVLELGELPRSEKKSKRVFDNRYQ